MDAEEKSWSEIDFFLELIEFLDDDQLCREAEVLYSGHNGRNVGCPSELGPGVNQFVKEILEAADSILQLYRETNSLHIKNRYVLYYYLALSQAQRIVILD